MKNKMKTINLNKIYVIENHWVKILQYCLNDVGYSSSFEQ